MAVSDILSHAQDCLESASLCSLEDEDASLLSEAHGKWQRSLDLILREDKVKCQAWNEEVQTLLIFAGLFSAVVTAFVIQSYQDIQQIPTNQAIALLLINNISSNPILSEAAIAISQRTSYNSSQRVNTVWFLSLTLSIITVLVGIITMQWIREYQRYSDSSTAKRKLAIRNMRTEGLEKWKVPEIIACLPLILQTAVVLFFIGLIDFLINVTIVIAIPVIVAVTIALLFICMTIIWPTMQCVLVVNGPIPSQQISQCPYKSPQAWTFLQTFSLPFLRWYILPIFVFPLIVVLPIFLPFALVIFKCVGLTIPTFRSSSHFMRNLVKNMGKKNLDSWDRYDGLFMKRRNQVILTPRESGLDKADMLSTAPFDYDASMGIARFLDDHVYDGELAQAAYDCFRELPTAIITDGFLVPKDDSRKLGDSGHCTRLSDVLMPWLNPTAKKVFQKREYEIMFLEHLLRPLEVSCVPTLRARQLKLFVWMLGHLYTDQHQHCLQHTEAGLNTITGNNKFTTPPNPHLLEPIVPSILRSCAGIHSLSEVTANAISEQILQLFQKFIIQILESDGRNLVSHRCKQHRDSLICDLAEVVHTVTVAASIRPSKTTSPLSQTWAGPLAEQFLSIVEMLSRISPSMSQEMEVLAFVGASFASCFRPKDLNIWKTRFPEGISRLTYLIRLLESLRTTRVPLIKFLNDNKRDIQWDQLYKMVKILPQQIQNNKKSIESSGHSASMSEGPGYEVNEVYFPTMSDRSACTSSTKITQYV